MNTAALRLWLDRLAPRERILVLAAAALAVAALIYAVSIRPLYNAHERAERRVADQRSLLSDLEQVARTTGPGTAAPVAVTGAGESLVVLVDRSTRERGLGAYLKRNQPEGAGSIRLRLENAPFDSVLEWLADVQARHGLKTSTASFDPSGEPGRVNSNLTLTRSSG